MAHTVIRTQARATVDGLENNEENALMLPPNDIYLNDVDEFVDIAPDFEDDSIHEQLQSTRLELLDQLECGMTLENDESEEEDFEEAEDEDSEEDEDEDEDSEDEDCD